MALANDLGRMRARAGASSGCARPPSGLRGAPAGRAYLITATCGFMARNKFYAHTGKPEPARYLCGRRIDGRQLRNNALKGTVMIRRRASNSNNIIDIDNCSVVSLCFNSIQFASVEPLRLAVGWRWQSVARLEAAPFVCRLMKGPSSICFYRQFGHPQTGLARPRLLRGAGKGAQSANAAP